MSALAQVARGGITLLWRYPYASLLSGVLFPVALLLFGLDAVALASDAFVTLLKDAGSSAPDWVIWGLRIDTEFGVWAIVGYLKLAAIAALLWVCRREAGLPAAGYLAVAFAITLADDMATLHERAGRALAGSFGGEIAVGETLFFAVVGIVILMLVYKALTDRDRRHGGEMWLITGGLLAIGFCAVFVNLAEGLVAGHSRLATKVLSLLDDGGELVASSFALLVALKLRFDVARRVRRG